MISPPSRVINSGGEYGESYGSSLYNFLRRIGKTTEKHLTPTPDVPIGISHTDTNPLPVCLDLYSSTGEPQEIVFDGGKLNIEI